MVQLPSTKQLKDAMLQVLSRFPNGLKTDEIDSKVADLLELTTEQREIMRSGNRSELSYRLAWERTHAKKVGLVERVGPRSWKIKN